MLLITGSAENAVLNHGHLDAGRHVLGKPFLMQSARGSRVKRLDYRRHNRDIKESDPSDLLVRQT